MCKAKRYDSGVPSVIGALRRLFGLDEQWVREVPKGWSTADASVAVGYLVVAALSMVTAHSLGAFVQVDHSLTVLYPWVLLPGMLLVLRRAYPLQMMACVILHFCVTAIWFPEVSPVFALQVFYFFSLFSMIAWARNRKAALAMTALMSLASALWVLGDVLLRGQLDQLRALPDVGPMPTTVAAFVQVVISTLTFFLTATLAGAMHWWSARRAFQERQLVAARSVSEERLRIARELHDVVGHDIAVVGIQTGAARRILSRDPERAAESMQLAEDASRAATTDLRMMLSALRPGDTTKVEDPRRPQPSMSAVPELVSEFDKVGLTVTYSSDGPVEDAPKSIGICGFRVVQESLTNVRRHSAASEAEVTARVERGADGKELRITIVDGGPARGATSGSQVGVVGMRERVELQGGRLEAGRTPDGGYRVEAVLPWSKEKSRG